MKRNTLSLCAVLALLCSCQIQELETPYEEDFSGKPEAREVIITASLADAAPETKTEVERTGSSYQVYWLPGDQIRIFSAGETSVFTSQNTERSISAPFRGTVSFVSGSDEHGQTIYTWGIYPARSDQVYDGTAGTIQTTLPSVQPGKAGSFADDLAISIGRSSSLSFSFKSAYSGLRVKFGGNDIVSISMSSNGGEALAGCATFGLDSENNPEVRSVTAGSSEVTVYAPGGVPFESGKDYYIVTLPKVQLSSGITLTLRRKDGTEGSFSLSSSITLKRNIFSVINANLDELITNWHASETQGPNEIWYTSTDGNVVQFFIHPSIPFLGYVNDFNNSIVSNTYADGKGVIRFESTLTEIPNRAFFEWNVCEESNLATISLPDFVETIAAKAFLGCSSLTSATMGDNLTHIYESAFSGCDLRSLRLPSSLEYLGGAAFDFNESLETVTIPESVTSLGYGESGTEHGVEWLCDNPFIGCTSLKAFYGKYATDDHLALIFTRPDNGRKSLVSFAIGGMEGGVYHIPDDVSEIGGSAFYDAKITGVDLNRVKSVGMLSFDRSHLASVTIPSSVEEIRGSAFMYCRDLSQIRIEGNGKFIPDGDRDMFYGTGDCPIYVPSAWLEVYKIAPYWSTYASRIRPWLQNNQIYYTAANIIENDFTATATSNDFVDGQGVLTFADDVIEIPIQAFYCTGLQSVVLPESVTSIKNYAFYGCSSLDSVSMQDGVTYIGPHAFTFCPFSSIRLSESLETIAMGAFESCSNLESVTIPQSVVSLGVFGSNTGNPFPGCNSLSAFYGKFASEDHRCLIVEENGINVLYSLAPDGLRYGSYALSDQIAKVARNAIYGPSVEDINLNCVETLADYSFNNCTAMTSIVLPATLTEMSYRSFDGCTGLTSITLAGDTPPVINGTGSSFTNIGQDFSIRIPGSSNRVYFNTSQWSGMSAHFVYYQSSREIWFHLKGNDLSSSGQFSSGDFGVNFVTTHWLNPNVRKDVTFPDGMDLGTDNAPYIGVAVFDGPVTSIAEDTFCYYSGLAPKFDYISIPSTVKYIRARAFSGCSSLLSFPHPLPLMISEIGEDAFYDCTVMKGGSYGSLDLWTCSAVGEGAFYGCKALKKVNLGTVQSLGDIAFMRCTGLTDVLIDGQIQSIGYRVFNECSSLASVKLGENITSIGVESFAGCYSLSQIKNVLENTPQVLYNIESVGNSAFQNCHALTSISLPDIQSLDAGAFGFTKTLSSIRFGPDLNSVSGYIFLSFSLDDILDGELEVYFEGSVPPATVSSEAFNYQTWFSEYSDTYKKPIDFGAIHVPSGTKSAYVTRLGPVFADKIVADL